MPELYVGLARSREIAVLDPVTDRVRARISLDPLGDRGRPGQLLVGPSGNAAMLPLISSESRIGVIAPPDGAARPPVLTGDAGPRDRQARPPNRAELRRCSWLGVGSGARVARIASAPDEVAQGLAADAAGFAYVLLGDWIGTRPSFVAVVDLRRGTVVRHLRLAERGEVVFALAAAPSGSQLYVATWRWADASGPGEGRLQAIDTTTGAVRTSAALPPDTAATDLALAPSAVPGTTAETVYAVVGSPGPTSDADDWWPSSTKFALLSLEASSLASLGVTSLERQPSALAVTADGRRAYLLSGPPFGSMWNRQLVSLDLAAGAATRRWPLPEGCLALAASTVGKVYVADTVGDRLWRVDARTDTFLGDVPMPGAPLALAAR